ncbi:MAG TPA: tetratricopeptide repeat protein [Chthoniobacterales bacterium]
MKLRIPPTFVRSLALAFCLTVPLAARAEVTVDQLLKKLPPPEKLIKSPTDRVMLDAQSLDADPMGKQLVQAMRRHDFRRGLDLARSLAKKYPQNPVAQSIHGAFAFNMRQFGEAADACHRAIALRPAYAEPYFGLGLIELAQNRPAKAIPHFQKIAELEPKQPTGWLLLSACYERTGQKQKAVEEARRATVVSPASAGAWVQLARTENGLGNSSETLHALLRAADLLPDSAAMMATIGYGYINLNRIPEAIPPLQRAAHFAPNDFLVQSQLGFCLEATGHPQAAMEHLHKGAELAPTYAPVWEHLGLAYATEGKHRDAVSSFERAVKIMPNYKQAWTHLATEYNLVGRPADARYAAARAASLKTASPNKSKKA